MQDGLTARVRPPAVAGAFYPADPRALACEVRALLATASRGRSPPGAQSKAQPKAVIVPHAGYIYSGAVAASAYALLADSRTRIRRVVLLGPSHRVPLRDMAVPSVSAFMTPLGSVALERAALTRLSALPAVHIADEPHELDHALEVQLPFLQVQLDNFQLVPVAVGSCGADLVADVLEMVWGGEETLIVVSTDMSHFRSYEEACLLDRDTSAAIVRGDASLRGEQACGCFAVNGLLTAAQRRGLHLRLLDQRNSGDTTGDRARVVGYASFAADAA